MARANTECTELSVGFGLLNIEPTNNDLAVEELSKLFEGTLSVSKYERFLKEFRGRESYYRRFWRIGIDLRNVFQPFANLSSLRWEGSIKQSSRVSTAIDLMAANTAISVKADSNVVSQPSAYSLFIELPSGLRGPRRTGNWFLKTAPEELQKLYLYARDRLASDYPTDVTKYLRKIKGQENKKRIGKALSSLSKKEAEEYSKLYLEMCRKVAQESADIFNDELAASTARGVRNSIVEDVVRQFLRLGDMPYILCGFDKDREFAVRIPNLTSWNSDWRVKSIHAEPDLSRGQSIVLLVLSIESKKPPRIATDINFEVQIRWSHRQLNGNPEAKFYKQFQWTDIPFFTPVCDFADVEKGKFIGSGGFANVFEAKLRGDKETYAMKELDVLWADEDARKRFEVEITLQRNLQHPHIMPIIHADLAAKVPWFLMPLAKTNLSERKGLSNNLSEVDRIFCQVLRGIEYAHNNDVIHRDIKPDNILFDEQNCVKISDFGLGKRPSDSLHLTHSSNNSMGTIAYAAPEQLDSFRDADHRADIYSLGKLLYFLVTQEEPHTLYLENIPEPYRKVIDRSTKKDPAQRYQSVRELAADFALCTTSS